MSLSYHTALVPPTGPLPLPHRFALIQSCWPWQESTFGSSVGVHLPAAQGDELSSAQGPLLLFLLTIYSYPSSLYTSIEPL